MAGAHRKLAHPSGTRRVFGNASALLALQAATYIVPLVVGPYLAHVLGVSLYGTVAFGLSIVTISSMFTDYGFNLSATYNISKHRDDPAYINRLNGAVLLCKVPLALAVLTLLLAFALTEKKYHAYEEYFALLSLGVLGQAFLPVWFFQGIEQMAYITVFTVVARLVYVVMILTLVVSPRQYELVAVANGVSWISAALTGLFIMVRIGYRPTWPGLEYSRQVFKESTGFFWSRAALATYTAGGSVYLGITSSPTQVAYYAAAQQLYNGAQSLLTPVSQALYPHMARERNFALLFKVIGGFTLLSFAGLAVGVVDGRWILRTLYGPDFGHSYPVLLGFLVVFLLAAPSTLLGYPFLGALGRIAKANTSVLYGGLLQVAILIALYVTSRTDAFDVVLAIIGVELLVIVLRLRSGIPAYLALVPGGAHRGPA